MTKLIPRNLIIILSGAILLALSCTPVPCYDETEAFMKASFYSNETKKAQPPDSLTLYGIGKDSSLLYDKKYKVEPALFPLNSSADRCSFVIKINGITDTLELRYTSFPHLISKECGYSFYHNLDTITHTKHTIDYIYIAKSKITTVNEENIRIFY
jgi:hypothetical protein